VYRIDNKTIIMKRMKLSELTGNEILAQSLMTWDYQIILPEGAVNSLLFW